MTSKSSSGVDIGEVVKSCEQALERMRKAEVQALKAEALRKGLFGLPNQTPSEKQMEAQNGLKKCRSVFDLMKAGVDPAKKSEDFIDTREDADPEKRFHHVGANDNKPKITGEQKAPGSGGERKTVFSVLKSNVAKAEMKPGAQPNAGQAPKQAGTTVAPSGPPKPQMPVAKAPAMPKQPKTPGIAKSERTVFGVLKKGEELQKKAPPGFSEATMKKLKAKYGEESAFKISWAAWNKKHGKKKNMKKSEADMPLCPYCGLDLIPHCQCGE